VHILSADGWLKAPENRGENVIERYDMNALNQLAQTLVNRKQDLTLQTPIYSKRDLKANCFNEKVIGPQDVVIIEGTIALLLGVAQGNASVHSWYVQIDELQRKNRLLTEYALRGRSSEDAQQIYAQRQIDEAPLIESAKVHASCCINLDLTDNLT